MFPLFAKESSMTKLKYANNGRFVHQPLWWHKRGLSQTASGYGAKLTSAYKTEFNGRLYRVYHICYSNASSPYIIVKGERLFLSNTILEDNS